MDTKVDAWGRVTIDYDAVSEALYNGLKLADLMVAPSPSVDELNERLATIPKAAYRLRVPEPLEVTPDEEHERRAGTWLIPEELLDLDVRAFVLGMCTTPAEKARVNMEMDLFDERELEPLLRTMIGLVDHLRQQRVVWGVGRGSSVASYVLYKIGVHRIDALKYDLSIREFLK